MNGMVSNLLTKQYSCYNQDILTFVFKVIFIYFAIFFCYPMTTPMKIQPGNRKKKEKS